MVVVEVEVEVVFSVLTRDQTRGEELEVVDGFEVSTRDQTRGEVEVGFEVSTLDHTRGSEGEGRAMATEARESRGMRRCISSAADG
jgi:hypothetical protein